MVLFIAGTIVCTLAHSVPTILVGRVLQGIGSGGGLSLVEIIITDMVPLKFRVSDTVRVLSIASNVSNGAVCRRNALNRDKSRD
jgi:MFS family permease